MRSRPRIRPRPRPVSGPAAGREVGSLDPAGGCEGRPRIRLLRVVGASPRPLDLPWPGSSLRSSALPRVGCFPSGGVRFGLPGCLLQSLVSLSPKTSFLQATQPLREAAPLPRVVSLLGELRMPGESGPSSSVRVSRGAHPEPRPSLSRGPSVPLPISGMGVDQGVPPRLVPTARSVLGGLVATRSRVATLVGVASPGVVVWLPVLCEPSGVSGGRGVWPRWL